MGSVSRSYPHQKKVPVNQFMFNFKSIQYHARISYCRVF